MSGKGWETAASGHQGSNGCPPRICHFLNRCMLAVSVLCLCMRGLWEVALEHANSYTAQHAACHTSKCSPCASSISVAKIYLAHMAWQVLPMIVPLKLPAHSPHAGSQHAHAAAGYCTCRRLLHAPNVRKHSGALFSGGIMTITRTLAGTRLICIAGLCSHACEDHASVERWRQDR